MITAWFGDTHGNLCYMWRLAQKWEERTGTKIDCVFQVGDFGIYPNEDRLDTPSRKYAERHGLALRAMVGDFPEIQSGEYKIPIPTYFIRGNHEDQEFLLRIQREKTDWYLNHPAEIAPNLFYIPDGCVFKFGDYRIAGWGGCYGKNTWEMGYWSNSRLQSPRRLNHMTRDVFERLLREKMDILVTHDAPTGCGLQGSPDPKHIQLDPESITEGDADGKGMPPIRQLIEETQPLYHFCGHWHEFHKTKYGRTTSFVLDKTIDDGKDRHCMEIIEL